MVLKMVWLTTRATQLDPFIHASFHRWTHTPIYHYTSLDLNYIVNYINPDRP